MSTLKTNKISKNTGSAVIIGDGGSDTLSVNATPTFIKNITASGTYTGGGLMTTGGNIIIPNAGNIGSASDTDAIAISSEGYVTQSGIPFVFVNGNDTNTRTLAQNDVFFSTGHGSQAAASITGSASVTGAGSNGITYTSSNGRFTVPVAGKYFVSGRFRYAETGDEAVTVTINTNGNNDAAYLILQCTEATTLIITVCVNLAASDYIRFLHGASGGDRGFYMANGHCGASIFLIG